MICPSSGHFKISFSISRWASASPCILCSARSRRLQTLAYSALAPANSQRIT